MADDLSLVPEEQYSADSIYGSFQDYLNRTGSLPTGYGISQWRFGDHPDTDPFGVESVRISSSGVKPLTSNEVTGLRLDDGRWVSRDELMRTEQGEALVKAEEDIRRGNKRGFWTALSETSLSDFIPFVGMLAKVGGAYSDAKKASDFFRKSQAGENVSLDEAIAGTLYRRENALASEGTWGYTFGSIVRQAPAFFMEFGLLGKAGQMARSALAKGVTKETSEAAAKSAATWATTRAVKVGAQEYAESAVRAFADGVVKSSSGGKTFLQGVQELASNPELRKQTAEQLVGNVEALMNSSANAVAGVAQWSPGLQRKVAENLVKTSLDDVLSRMSADSVVQRAWRGTVQSVRKSVAEGLIDLGSWGTDAATTITTSQTRAAKAAADAVTQLTFGALARGSALYLPKEAVTRTVGAVLDGKNANALGLEAAAWQNDDPALMEKAERYGAMLDLLEYVSESTGRGFNQAARAVGLAVAPGLIKPGTKVAGLSHIVGADVRRDAAGRATNVVYNGLIEQGSMAEAGGKFRQFLEKAFGKRALRENVADHRFRAAKAALGDVDVGSDVALQKTLDTGVLQPGLSDAAAGAIGPDVRKFVKESVKALNKSGLDDLKYKSYLTYAVADFLTRNNIDAIAAGDLFRTMGYDGVVGEMLEERYSDFAKALFGLDAFRDHTFSDNVKRAVAAAFAFDENGDWRFDQLTAEAAAFAVPLVARAGTMRAIAALGGPNKFEKFKSDAALFSDAVRYDNVTQMAPGDYLLSLQRQGARLNAVRAKAQKAYDDEMEARRLDASRAPGDSPRVPLDENTMNGLLDTVARAKTGISRLKDVRRHFLETNAGTTGSVSVPVISDEELLAPAERYNLMLKTKESQSNLRRSVTAGDRLRDDFPEMCQTMFMMEDRDRLAEDASWFRRASHWVVEHAVRLGGVAVTGDVSFLSANPARFSAASLGVPGNVLDLGRNLYRDAFQRNLSAARDERAAEAVDGRSDETPYAIDYDGIHEKTLADIREEARGLMTTALAVHHTRLFSDDEIRDVAMQEVARQDGYAADAERRVFVNSEGDEVSFSDYLNRRVPGETSVAERVDAEKSRISVELFSMLTRGADESRMVETSTDDAVKAFSDIITIPKELPTAQQAIATRVARAFPQFRTTTLAREADGSRSLDDHFNEVSVNRKWWDSIVSTVLPEGPASVDATTDLEKIYKNVENVHPAILETVARDLNIAAVKTRAGITARNRVIARLAIMSATAEDPDLRVFARAATDRERNSRFASPFGVQSPARFNGREWIARVTAADSGNEVLVRAATAEELAGLMSEYGYQPVAPKQVFTSYSMLQSSDPLEMIRVLGLGSEYERRMSEVSDVTKRDPLLRKLDDGSDEFSDEDSAERQRDLERMMAGMYEARKSTDPSLYLRSGERLKTEDGQYTPEGIRAATLANDCKACWFRRNGRADDGSARGYVAVADDLLRENGVTVPFSSADNAYGLASQGRRQKYVISIRALQSRGLAKNVYVPINHGSAQDYESAILDSALMTAYAKHRIYLGEVYKPLVLSFMDHVSGVCDSVSTSLAAAGNTRVADLVNDFKNRIVSSAGDRRRLPSPATFAEFVSAFNLFRTEVSPVWRKSALGAHAEALCAIAPDVRKGTAFLGWTSVVDRVLGGSGLERSAFTGEAPVDGLGKYYALWAPKGSPSLKEALETAHPGSGSFAEFAERTARQAQATVQVAVERNAESSVDTVPVSTEDDPLALLHTAQHVMMSEGLSSDDALDEIAVRNGETRASVLGGDTESGTSDETRPADETADGDDVRTHYDEEWAMGGETGRDFYDVTDTGTASAAPFRDHPTLKPSELRSAVQTFSQMAVSVYGVDSASDLNVPTFREFVRTKIMANPREADLDAFMGMFREMKRSGTLSSDVSWSINDAPDSDEEGIMPDGVEGNSQRAVDILKSKALTNWLAMFSLVSPQTGRDFQPLVEDIRSLLRASPVVMPDRSPDLAEADEFLSGIVNPRAETGVDNAAARDSLWRRRMSWFEYDSGHRKDIVRYIRAYLGENGEPPVNARAAVLLSYLLNVADRTGRDGVVHRDSAKNVRLSLASLIGSAATAQPVRLRHTPGFGANGNFRFDIERRRQRVGNVSLDSVVGSFSRLAAHTGDEIAAIASDLEKRFSEQSVGLSGAMYGNGVTAFSTWASILSPVFGYDSPIVSVFLSRPMYGYLNAEARVRNVISTGFRGSKDGSGIPFAAAQLVSILKDIARKAGDGLPSHQLITGKAVELFQAGAPSNRAVVNLENSVQGQAIWMKLFQAYMSARPVSVMRAEVDPERTSKPASSLAITMPGIEPAVLEFMDRKDEWGFPAVARKWFPARFSGLSDEAAAERIADYRQRMVWPNSAADSIVAKSVSKSALASELLNGCETAYEGNAENMVYVPVYSGDHSSSIIIQVPLMKEFKEAGMSYYDAAGLVSRWIGLELLGTDAKRSALTCLEAPGTSMWDYEYTASGDIMTEARARILPKAGLTGSHRLTPVSARTAGATAKDQKKFNLLGGITKYIGFGPEKSSSDHYAKTSFASIANTGSYTADDIVGVSVNGSRPDRVSVLTDRRLSSEVLKALSAGATVITDRRDYRESSGFNVGERELAEFLSGHGYTEINGTGVWVPADSEPVRGHSYVAIAWNSDPDANNEAFIGTSEMFGYGADRQKEMAKDPHSSTLKVHVASTGQDKVYGPVLSLIKSLALSPSREGGRGQFLAGDPKRILSDFAWSLIKGEEHRSSVVVTDADSIKLSQANSKTVGASDGSDKPVALMNLVFSKLAEALRSGGILDANGNTVPVGSEISGDDLDRLVGDADGKIEWKNLGGTGKRGRYAVSELLPGASLREIRREGDFGGHRMFALVFEADDLMSFQVANVSHRAAPDFSRTPRNYMTDAGAFARILRGHNGDTEAGTSLFAGIDRVCDDMEDLMTSWGFIGAAVSSQTASVDSLLAEDEEWTDAVNKGEPVNGDYSLDLRQRTFAAVARRDNLAVQFFNSAAPLVSNGAWIGADGRVRTHSGSKMFNDTVQGSRTIAFSDREFFRGNKRVALANVNNTDVTFRHGMYIDKDRLYSVFADELGRLADEDSRSERYELSSDHRKITALLDFVISKILDNEYAGVTGRNNAYRRMLAECLIDHRGNRFVDRYTEVDVAVRNADGYVLDANGHKTYRRQKGYLWKTVSYADLFTSVTSASGDSMEFDRTAVYAGMHNDVTGEDHFYLGGTMMGFPRTPSYGGHLEVVRAALPVTETVDADGRQWRSGLDSAVAPDPYTLAILGCDHDGDKTNLYMLKPGAKGTMELAELRDLLAGVDEFISRHRIADPDFRHLSAEGRAELEGMVDRLVSLGYLEYETRKEKDADGNETVRRLGLRFTRSGKASVSNLFVQGLFDMNRALPVTDGSESEVPLYDGFRADGETRGSFFHGVKAKPAPDAPKEGRPATYSTAAVRDPSVAWDLAVAAEGVLGAKVLDAASGRTIGDPRTATSVQDGAAAVSEARAVTVSLAGSFHTAFQSGLPIGIFAGRTVSEQDFVDFIYHFDGLSNMTFDDIKEQLCTRLGIRPNMMNSITADIIREAGPGRLPTTDREFISAFVKYGKAFNDEKASRHWMARASDPADYRFQAEFGKLVPGHFGYFIGEKRSAMTPDLLKTFGFASVNDVDLGSHGNVPAGSVADILKTWIRTKASDTGDDVRATVEAEVLLRRLMRSASSLKNPLNGFTYWLTRVADENMRLAGVDDILGWIETVDQIDETRKFASSVSYTKVDPASNTSASEAKRLADDYEEIVGRFVADDDPRYADVSYEELRQEGRARVPGAVLRRVHRMRAGTALMYDDSVGLVVAARGIRAATGFRGNLRNAVIDYGRSVTPPGGLTSEAAAVMAFASAPLVSSSDVMACEANMQSVPWTMAAFDTCEAIDGSPLNRENLYDVLDYLGRSLAYIRGANGTNVSLSARYGVEAMVDLVARLVVNSTAHDRLHIFDFIRETPDANSSGYKPDVYGPSAEGLSRIRPAFEHVSEAQRTEVSGLFERVVSGRELDSGSSLLKDLREVNRGFPMNVSFAMSSANLLKIHDYLSKQRLVAEQGGSNRAAFERSIREGSNRDLLKTVRELYFAFTGKRWNGASGRFEQVKGAVGLDGKFGKGFSIEPSALFGQVLPVYACSTARVSGPAGTDSGSLIAIMPDRVYARLAERVAWYHNSDGAPRRWADMAAAVNYAPTSVVRVSYDDDTGEETGRKIAEVKKASEVLAGFASAEDELHSIAADAAASVYDAKAFNSLFESFRSGARLRSRLKYEPGRSSMYEPPRGLHHTLSIFDGVRGVAFRSALEAVRPGNAAQRPAVRPKPATQARPAPAERESAAPETVRDPKVQEIADRMSAVLRMWDMGRVEYSGGSKMTLRGKFHDRDGSAVETSVDVEIVPGRGILSDEKLVKLVVNRDPSYLQSLAVKSGRTAKDISDMPVADRITLARRLQPVGVSTTFRPGTGSAERVPGIGAWRLDAKAAGVLTGRIRLAADSGDPNVIYHEFFHSVMGFLRTLGSLSSKEVAALNAKYGDSLVYGKDWFDEDKAAEDFKALVEGRLKPEEGTGFLSRLRAFLDSLLDLVFGYGNDMAENPLAGIVLTGRVRNEAPVTRRQDFAGRFDEAVRTFVGVEMARGRGWEARFLPDDAAGNGDFISVLRSNGAEPGDSVYDNRASYVDPYLTRENMILVDYGVPVNRPYDLGAFADFISRTDDIYSADTDYEAKRSAMDELEKAFPDGSLFRKALVRFTRKYGPKVVRATESGGTAVTPETPETPEREVASGPAETVPNPVHDSDIADILDGVVMVGDASDTERMHSLDADEGWYAVAEVRTELNRVISRVNPTRMNRPYNVTNTLAGEIGRAIAEGIPALASDVGRLKHLNRTRKVALDAEQKARVLNAVRQVGSLYGVDVSDTTAVENLLFRALGELYQRVAPDGTLVPRVGLSRGGSVLKETLVTPNALASAIVTANGVRPCDILELTIADVNAIADATRPDGTPKYGPDSTFRANVIRPVLSALERIRLADPARVMYDNGTAEDLFGNALSSIRAGLTNPKLRPDGTREDFALGEFGTSKNPYHDDNIRSYADHVSNPDFQAVMHTVLDRLYTLRAAGRWYRQIGFEPGRPEDTIAVRGIAPSVPEPFTHAETMASLSVAPEQLDEQEFSATDYYDAPAFIAQHPEAWLDSLARPNFGNVSLRQAQQEERRQIAGFHVRAGQLDNLMVRALGLNAVPGQGLDYIDRDYVSRFSMVSGKTVREDGAAAIKFEGYSGRKAIDPGTGETLTVDIDDQRRADMTYKMMKIRAQGGRYMLTGVDDLTFGPSDSCDPAHYTEDAVRERAKRGPAGGYTDFDRFLVRMNRQLRDDPDGDWTDVTGPDGLNLRARVVDAACRALRQAKTLVETTTGPGRFLPADVNDFVLRRLTEAGLIQSHERIVEGHENPVRVSGTLVISADEWEEFWKKSPTYAKLVKAGRDERTLGYGEGSIAKELMGLYRDVMRFVDAHPYLSDGDGAFFHNLSTPLPWVGGDGYTMYALNRNEHAKTGTEKATEALSEYERKFAEFVGSPTLESPASDADDGMMRLFRVLFHTKECDAEAVRQAMARGEYERLPKGATQRDLALAVYDALTGLLYAENGDVTRKLGGPESLRRMLKTYERRSRDGSGVVSGGNGMTDDVMYRTTGILPANHQLGHAVRNAIDGITNAFAFRAALFNMMTTPDEDGMPTCYARPADDAVRDGGLPDALWGAVARWWAETNGLQDEYDIARTGVQNAQHIYDRVAEQVQNGLRTVKDDRGNERKVRYGELSNAEIDPKSVTAFMARSENPEDASDLGSYAMGYAKHLFQSTRTLGTRAVTKQIHRAWAWSKGLSVNFSYFFPLATRFESPIGAVGFVATVGGNVSPDWVRRHAELLSALQSPVRRTGWITQDFLGQKDIMSMLDSNDPYLAELYHWAGVIGITLSDSSVNPMEHSRSYLQSDLNRFVGLVRRKMGSKAARRVKEISNEILVKGGDRAFTYHLNATKLAVVAQMCTRLQAEAARAGRAFDPVRDLKRYAGYINSEVGGIDPLQFAWAHPVMQSRMNALFFSWGWTRGAWEAGGGTALEQLLFGGQDVTPEERRYYVGRWIRMFGEVMIGVPAVAQVISKALGMLLVAGLDPDDQELPPEERRRLADLIERVRSRKWFTWQNEDKAFLWQYDLTPLMAGITARFPSFSKFIGRDHPWVKTASGLLMAATRNPLFALGALPTYEGTDDRNSTTAGRGYYQHFGKQGWEEIRWFQNPVKQFFSKLAMPVQRLAEGIMGRSLTYLDHPQPWDRQGDIERWMNPSLDGAMFNLIRAFIPFSVASLGDTSDAGLLSLAAPVSMGASGSDVKERFRNYLKKWAENDRGGYSFGGMSRKEGQKYAKTLAGKSVTVAHLVDEAMRNGYTEKGAYELLDGSLNTLVSGLYGKILDELPKEPDGEFDARRLAKLLRACNRYGRFRKDVFEALKKRLETQQRWGYLQDSVKSRMKEILEWGTGRDAYDTAALDRLNSRRYDY